MVHPNQVRVLREREWELLAYLGARSWPIACVPAVYRLLGIVIRPWPRQLNLPRP